LLSLAIAFSKKWEKASKERPESQLFLKEFLNIFGITVIPSEHFEYPVCKRQGQHGYIDCFLKEKIAIEMKSKGKSLADAFRQLKEYVQSLPEDISPEIIMVCDFETIIVDIDKKKIDFKLTDLRKHLDLFRCLLGKSDNSHLQEQMKVNVRAAEKMAKLHNALESCGYAGRNLEVYLVRLLFCLFAEDTNIFPQYSFLEYVRNSKKDGSDLLYKIAHLFEILNTSDENRKAKTNLPAELSGFQYINGGLFAESLPFADFTEKMRGVLIECAEFDWSNISPAIFGAMFQGVMDKEHRREIGAHYTSEENILKLINPLFMDGLREEFGKVKNSPKKLEEFHDKIAALKFLDPACGCGNFLIIAYRELRRLELEILKAKEGKNRQLSFDILWNLLRVNVSQFYGIEHEEFPCEIARVGMWLTDHQMNLEASELFGCYYARLPLTQGATIVHGNALRIDWEGIAPKTELSYILGNPPFVGARLMSPAQKEDMLNIFGTEFKGTGNLDYVTAWYKRAADYTLGTGIKCAFVSTNSITQGEQVPLLWKPLMENGIHINFGIPTFKWSNEAKGKAAVYCVIAGFSYQKTDNDLNPYLLKAPTIFIESRSKPLCNVPEIGIGNKPIDGGNYLFTESEKDEFLRKEPQAEKWFRKWIGSDEFINRYFRYCLWLGDCSPDELRKMPECMKRVEAVRQFRLASTSEGTRKIAETPRRFHVENIPQSIYILIPRVSSERRKYIPIGFISPSIIASDSVLIIPGATLYHFGILTSDIHNAWMRAVCGRLEMRYRYSKDIVYNNFPWPNATDVQKAMIEKLAQGVLDARAKFPESSLADLYDPLSMPPELLKAHRELDKAVMKLYGFGNAMSEADVVVELMGRMEKIMN
ncbi:MAG: hypothetical protein LBQ76_02770, partial [Candidatus Fibromonas sp.]|nr:hypothetical protein [Candidatus Fibromonas sp.]